MNSYIRKTTNPRRSWSEERKAERSAHCIEAHANGTWYKKSKKVRGSLISGGMKEAKKDMVDINQSMRVIAEKVKTFFDVVENTFGIRPNSDEFISSAIKEKLAKVAEALTKN